MQQYSLKNQQFYGNNAATGVNELEGGATFDDHFYQ
jgi:hypothetical protein